MTIESARRLSKLLQYFDDRTIFKGRQYYDSGKVRSCAEKDGKVMGIVAGERDYLSILNLSDTKSITGTKCSCPIGANCKHTVALACMYAEKGDQSFAAQMEKREYPDTEVVVHEDLSSPKRSSAHLSVVPPIRSVSIFDPSRRARNNGAVELPPASPDFDRAMSMLRQSVALEEYRRLMGQDDRAQKSKSQTRYSMVYALCETENALKPAIKFQKMTCSKNGEFHIDDINLETALRGNVPAYITAADLSVLKLWDTIREKTYWSYNRGALDLPEDPELMHLLLSKIIATGRCFVENHYQLSLSLGNELSGRLSWENYAEGRMQQLVVVASDGDKDYPCLLWRRPWYVDLVSGYCGPVRIAHSAEFLSSILRIPPLNEDDAIHFQLKLPELGLDDRIPMPKSKRLVQIRPIQPKTSLAVTYLTPPEEKKAKDKPNEIPTVVLNQSFDNTSAANSVTLEGDNIVKLFQNKKAVDENVELLSSFGFTAIPPGQIANESAGDRFFTSEDPDAWLKLSQQLDELKQRGWSMTGNAEQKLSPIELFDDDLAFEIEEEDSWWFSLALNIEVGGKRVPLLPIMVAALKGLPNSDEYSDLSIDLLNKNGKFHVMLRDQLLSLPFDRVRPMLVSVHELLLRKVEPSGKIKMSAVDAADLLSAANELNWRGAEGVFALTARLRKLKELPEAISDEKFKAELRPYQVDGLAWLQMLAQQKFGGILADDMGLGKTIQLLAFVCAERQAGRLKKRPFLVVSPTSVLPNWQAECARFAPHLKVLALSGQDRAACFDKVVDADLVLTTYPLMVRDQDTLKGIHWSGIALDEAQAIKNPKTQVAKTACLLKADYRFCLTGTPIENHLGEFWSQFHFLLPGLLGDSASFNAFFRTRIEKQGDPSVRALLAARVKPFIMRRCKEEVAKDLPEKSEIIKHVELEGPQRDLYETVRLTSTKKVRDEIAKKGFKQSQIMILDALLKLRQVCCDSRLVNLSAARKVTSSAKLTTLMEMIEELLEAKRKVLIFSQFTSMLDLVAAELNERAIPYVELRGDTTDRVKPVHEFQNTSVPLFLLSLKSGGTGLNLTAADTVIHYDPWWNPAVEDQATDRAHRIGQTKNVFVYKLVAKGTIEERMLEMQAKKRIIASSIYVEGGNQKFALSETDIEMLLKPIDDYE